MSVKSRYNNVAGRTEMRLVKLGGAAILAGAFAVMALMGASSAQAQASGSITVAIGAEPATMLPREACRYETNFVTDNIYERLTQRDGSGKVVGWLAESYQQLDDNTWRFKLRPGIKFSDGEPLNADAVVTTVKYYFNPDKASRCAGDYATIASASKVDDMTVDIKTSSPDPTIPSRLLKMYIIAPKWLTDTPDEKAALTAVGTGPYTFSEWVKGDHITLKANPNYWGNPKPTIGEVKIVTRGEAAVRAAMVQAGEADVAINISKDQAKSLPKSVVEHTTESVFVRLNTQNPVLKDIRVRQAIAEAIDSGTIRDALYPGVSSALKGQIVRPSSLGFNPDLQDYAFNPEDAKKLIQEAGANGAKLDLIVRTDLIPNVSELAEAMQSQLQDIGLQVNLVPMEAAPWRDLLFANKEGQKRTDMIIISASNIQFDTSRVMNFYFGMGQFSHADSPEFQAKMDKAAVLKGDARAAAYKALWSEAHDNYWVVPIFGIDYIHGLSARVNWTPRDDGFVYFNAMTLAK
jgi:peptide/nickel transport system substrate-binding protein